VTSGFVWKSCLTRDFALPPVTGVYRRLQPFCVTGVSRRKLGDRLEVPPVS
jgi:hypothetical protein